MKTELNYISALQIFKGTLVILGKEQNVLINKWFFYSLSCLWGTGDGDLVLGSIPNSFLF
jgi:hypothetical protein